MIISTSIVSLFLLPVVAAQPAAPAKAIVLKAARLFDGKSDSLIPGGLVIVEGKAIRAVGAGLTIPDGATVVDLGDATICPGFIDAHTHLTHERTADFNQGFVDGMRREVAEQAILSTVYARRTVEAGFTTVRDVGSGDLLDVGLRNSIAKGVVPGPRMLVCVHALGAVGGHADTNGLRHDLLPQRNETEGIATGPDQLRAAVRFQVKRGADVIKFCASGGVLSLADEVDTPQLTLAEMTALCDEAHRLRKKVACHCHGDQAARDAVLAGVNSIEHGSFLSADTLKLMKERGTYLIPTLMAPDSIMPNLSKFPPEIAAKAVAANAALSKAFAEAVKLGVKVGFGTDSGVSKHGQNAREFVLMVEHGMTPMAALRAATSVDAELLGLSKSIGTLEQGKLADIVAVPGDPIADIAATGHVMFVMKEGAVVLNRRLNTATRAGQAVAPDAHYAELTRQLEPWVAAEVKAKALPALSIALIDDQQIVWARGFGFADAADTVPATADTVYRVGSVSKLFTDLAVMRLDEQGRLDLDAPMSRVLPEFAPVNPFKVPITLRHLMSHRAGLVREPPVGHYFDPSQPSLSAVVRSLAGTTLLAEPGTRTKYSNAGIAVVGAVVERVTGKPFGRAIEDAILKPLGMTQSSFEPGPDLARKLAHGLMWTYDGQKIATPTFLLGTGPAGNLVSSANDLGRFISFLFAGGRGPSGAVVRPETLRSMIEPSAAGESAGFGLGFAISKLDGERRIGHNGAVYGFATDVQALPDSRLGVAVITSADCANGIASHIATTALRMMLAVRKGQPVVAPVISTPVSRERAVALAGHYASGASAIDIVDRDGRLLLSSFGGMTVEIRSAGDSLMIDDRLVSGRRLETGDNSVRLGGTRYHKEPAAKPALSPGKWEGLIGEYGWDHDVLYILEKDGKLHALIEWFFDYPLKEVSPDRFAFPDHGLYAGEALIFRRDQEGKATQVEAASVVFKRRHLDGEGGKTFRIVPRRPIEEVRRAIRSARPPVERGEFRQPDLVELISLDPTIKLDIRYATTNNFLGVPCYTSARAFMERPAAEALLRAHRALARQGYGLLIHDAYRPWQITKLFWEATPDSGRMFVADPAKGSKHNRGAAVDLTLYELATGKPVKMVGGYDEMSPRSFPDYPGGTSLERWHREVLREAMEAEGFTVNEYEWWHFDHRDWKAYPIIDLRFEDLAGLERGS